MFPVNVSFRDFGHSDAVEDRIQHEAKKLYKIDRRVESCQVVISAPHRNGQHGKIFHVNIKLLVPGKVLAVSHEPEHNRAHEDAFVAIRDAFRAMKNELSHYANKRAEKVGLDKREFQAVQA